MLLQGQSAPLDLSCVFNLDSLPVSFGPSLSESQDQRSQMNDAIKELSKTIWQKGGFRFWHRRTDNSPLKYIFFCCQDNDRIRKRESKGLRDRPQMKRFSCASYLAFTPSLLNRTLTITLRHTYHIPYASYELSEAVLEFIQNGHRYTTPAEIFRDIQAARIEGWESVASHQVYYQWHLGNSANWRHHSDPVLSAQSLLSERPDIDSIYQTAANVRALTLYIKEAIDVLVPHTQEMAMDATYGTNNMGMELFAVMAEVDGAGALPFIPNRRSVLFFGS